MEPAKIPLQTKTMDLHSKTADVSVPTDADLIPMGMKPKLPKLHINKFSGDVTRFRSFWESFDSAVNKNPTLSAIDKFNYLKALLEGQAASAIQGLSLSESNYGAALELLQQRFRQTQQILSAHMDELLKLLCCSGDKVTQLRAVYDKND